MYAVNRLRYLVSLGLLLNVSCVSSRTSLGEARRLAGDAATEELARCEREESRYSPDVRLRLSDYSVSVTESLTAYRFCFLHDNPFVPWGKWLGHPMRFYIEVRKSDGSVAIPPSA